MDCPTTEGTAPDPGPGTQEAPIENKPQPTCASASPNREGADRANQLVTFNLCLVDSTLDSLQHLVKYLLLPFELLGPPGHLHTDAEACTLGIPAARPQASPALPGGGDYLSRANPVAGTCTFPLVLSRHSGGAALCTPLLPTSPAPLPPQCLSAHKPASASGLLPQQHPSLVPDPHLLPFPPAYFYPGLFPPHRSRSSGRPVWLSVRLFRGWARGGPRDSAACPSSTSHLPWGCDRGRPLLPSLGRRPLPPRPSR